MKSIKLTSKRQVTLPKALCDELKLGPGDQFALERRVVHGKAEWVIRPCRPDWSWIGSASKAAKGKRHGLKAIRASIARGARR